MSKELYFIPMIAKVLRRSNWRPALREAFERITDLGRDDQFRVGYEQFLWFMACSIDQWATDSFGDPDDPVRQVFEARRCDLLLERDGNRVVRWSLDRFPFRGAVVNVQPGLYRLAVDTGWALWEETLTPTELLFTHAFPQHGLPLAAQTDEVMFPVTRDVSLLDGALKIRVHPGLESGVLELLFT
jgi:hypothetical protein